MPARFAAGRAFDAARRRDMIAAADFDFAGSHGSELRRDARDTLLPVRLMPPPRRCLMPPPMRVFYGVTRLPPRAMMPIMPLRHYMPLIAAVAVISI